MANDCRCAYRDAFVRQTMRTTVLQDRIAALDRRIYDQERENEALRQRIATVEAATAHERLHLSALLGQTNEMWAALQRTPERKRTRDAPYTPPLQHD